MTDFEIRQSFHKKKLHKHHANKNTLVINELGLHHGKNRADIAVINGHFIGYEIKGNADSLSRLKQQVHSYNNIFSKNYIIVGTRYQKVIHKYVPKYWGIIISEKGKRNAINFILARKAYRNENTSIASIIRLLWRSEVVDILKHNQISPKLLRQPRSILYKILLGIYPEKKLQRITIEYLKRRKDWRDPK